MAARTGKSVAVSFLLTPQFVVLAWIFAPLPLLSIARAVLVWRGAQSEIRWEDLIRIQLSKMMPKLGLAVALAAVGFWI